MYGHLYYKDGIYTGYAGLQYAYAYAHTQPDGNTYHNTGTNGRPNLYT